MPVNCFRSVLIKLPEFSEPYLIWKLTCKMEKSILCKLPYQTSDTNILTIQVYILFKIDRKNSLLRFLRTKKESIPQNQPPDKMHIVSDIFWNHSSPKYSTYILGVSYSLIQWSNTPAGK